MMFCSLSARCSFQLYAIHYILTTSIAGDADPSTIFKVCPGNILDIISIKKFIYDTNTTTAIR